MQKVSDRQSSSCLHGQGYIELHSVVSGVEVPSFHEHCSCSIQLVCIIEGAGQAHQQRHIIAVRGSAHY